MTNTESEKPRVFKEATAIEILLIYTKIQLKKTNYKNLQSEISINLKLNTLLIIQNIILGLLYFLFLVYVLAGLSLKIFSNSQELKTISAIALIVSVLLFLILMNVLMVVLFFKLKQKSRFLIAQSQKISKNFKDEYEIKTDEEERLSQYLFLNKVNEKLLKNNTKKELIEKTRQTLIKYIDKNSLCYLADCIEQKIQSNEEKQERFISSAPLVVCALIIIVWFLFGLDDIQNTLIKGNFNNLFLALMGLSPFGLIASVIVTLLLSSKPEAVKIFEEWQLILKRIV